MSFVIDNSYKYSNFKGNYIYSRKISPLIDQNKYSYEINQSDVVGRAVLSTKHKIDYSYRNACNIFDSLYQQFEGKVSNKMITFPYQYTLCNESSEIIMDETIFDFPSNFEYDGFMGFGSQCSISESYIFVTAPAYEAVFKYEKFNKKWTIFKTGVYAAISHTDRFVAIGNGGSLLEIYQTYSGILVNTDNTFVNVGQRQGSIDVFDDNGRCTFVVGDPGYDSGEGAFYIFNYNGYVFVKQGPFQIPSIGKGGVGLSVSINTNFVVVPVPFDDLGEGKGRVCIFRYPNYTDVICEISQPDARDPSSYFGSAVCINLANQIVIGAYDDDKVYVYEMETGLTYRWKNTQTYIGVSWYVSNKGLGYIVASDPRGYGQVDVYIAGEKRVLRKRTDNTDYDGFSLIACDRNQLIVGYPSYQNYSGRVYLYDILMKSDFIIPFKLCSGEELIADCSSFNSTATPIIEQSLTIYNYSSGTVLKECFDVFYEIPIVLLQGVDSYKLAITCSNPVQSIYAFLIDESKTFITRVKKIKLLISGEVVQEEDFNRENSNFPNADTAKMFVDLIPMNYVYTPELEIEFDSTQYDSISLYVFYDVIGGSAF